MTITPAPAAAPAVPGAWERDLAIVLADIARRPGRLMSESLPTAQPTVTEVPPPTTSAPICPMEKAPVSAGAEEIRPDRQSKGMTRE